MDPSYRHIAVEGHGATCCARLCAVVADEQLGEVFAELRQAAGKGCRRLLLGLRPAGQPSAQHWSSAWLGQLVALQRDLASAGLELVLCEVSSELAAMIEIFAQTTKFRVAADMAAALANESSIKNLWAGRKWWGQNSGYLPPEQAAPHYGKIVAWSPDGTQIVDSDDDVLALMARLQARGENPDVFVYDRLPFPGEVWV
jgi:hypothetical protein